jgi:hypothetical protein
VAHPKSPLSRGAWENILATLCELTTKVKQMSNQIGKIPDFAPQGEEVKDMPEQEVKEGEEITPAESSTAEKPIEETETTSEQEAVKPEVEEVSNEEAEEAQKQIKGLNEQRESLLREISELRGQRRVAKQEKLMEVEQKISDELTDIAPEDVQVIEKVLKARGYVTREEAKNLSYEDIKNQEIEKFLAKYPEYKPENDPNDIRWSTLNKEVSNFKRPSDPRQVGSLLEKARRLALQQQPVGGQRDINQVKKQIKNSALGSGGVSSPSSPFKSLSEEKVQIYRNGGWTEEEIKEIEREND